ncbi:hypothetical protein [Lacticaseibacillus zhaodongensis]|uniref:hypothetical protein n=1 Tax=Lacticaseibacillus zhaodongensis TaxID=2668065 RepID=UPI0012D2B9D5|nr:hypothetical protein [Lacticaseibacillus zhaodongensis]
MDHYDGPAFRRDGEPEKEQSQTAAYQLPPQKHAEKAGATHTKAVPATKEPVYHSVDPMAQFVTPPSTVNRRVKPKVDYAAIIADFARDDEDVVLFTTAADGDVVDLDQLQSATAAPVPAPTKNAAQPVAPATEVNTTADEAPAPSTTPTAAATPSSNASVSETSEAVAEEEWWPVEIVRPKPPLPQDGSPVQHQMTLSALTPRVAPAPTWLAIHVAITNYFRVHPEQLAKH